MSSRLRNINSSKISFFAFQDIITAVSGILILVTLILATDLERPAQGRSQDADAMLERRLQETLRQQMEANALNHHLQDLLAGAETAPVLEKLDSDISQLHVQLSEEQQRRTVLDEQLGRSQSAIEARDKTLGFTDLKATIQRLIKDVESIAKKDAKARKEMVDLELQVTQSQSQLFKLRQREGQLWLIPDKSSTSKEPILVTVSGAGASIERFDHPSERKELHKANAGFEFETYLGKTKILDQYVVFLVRPSGIRLFQDLLKTARDKNFDVGFDALEEDREIHFSTPPVVDDTMPSTNVPSATPNLAVPYVTASRSNATTSQTNSVPLINTQKTIKPQQTTPSEPPLAKSWWQKLLEFVGLG